MKDTKLYRSNTDKIIAGVCGGLGEYFEIDPLLIRLIFVVSFLFAGSGFLVYIIFWILIPKKNEKSLLNEEKIQGVANNLKQGAKDLKEKLVEKKKKRQKRLFLACFLILLGVIFIVNKLALPYIAKIIFSWPLILIFIGVFLLIRHK